MSLLAAACLAASATLQQPGRSDSLTLEQALARARAERPRSAASAAGVDRARGAQRVATMVPNPVVQGEKADFAPTHKVFVTQQLSWLPRRAADVTAARAGVSRAAADSAQLIADMGREVRRAFFGALAAQQQLQVVTEQLAVADSLTAIARRRAAAGDISDFERDQVAQEGGRARLATSQATEAARVARVELARTVAMTDNALVAARGALDIGLDDVDALLTSVDQSTVPVVRAAHSDSVAADARLRSASIARLPIPGVLAGREWGAANGVPSVGNVKLGLTVPLPIWNQGNEPVAEARGALALGSAQLAETRLAVAAQIAAARARVEESAARARFARDSLLPQARQIRAGAVRLYDAGRTSVVPVLDAVRTEREMARTAITEMLSFQQARADLRALLGRWE